MPDALISSKTSPGPGVGSGNSTKSRLRSPVKTTPRMNASRAFRPLPQCCTVPPDDERKLASNRLQLAFEGAVLVTPIFDFLDQIGFEIPILETRGPRPPPGRGLELVRASPASRARGCS